MRYTVTKQYGRGPEISCQSFKELKQAEDFVNQEIKKEALMNVKVVYRVSEFGDVISEIDSAQVDVSDESKSGEAAGGSSASSRFSPTPLANAPRPAGVPHSWVKDANDKDKDKE